MGNYETTKAEAVETDACISCFETPLHNETYNSSNLYNAHTKILYCNSESCELSSFTATQLHPERIGTKMRDGLEDA